MRRSHTKPASAASTFLSCKSHHRASKSDILTHQTPYRALNSSTYRSPFGVGLDMTEVYTEKKVLLCFVFPRVSLGFFCQHAAQALTCWLTVPLGSLAADTLGGCQPSENSSMYVEITFLSPGHSLLLMLLKTDMDITFTISRLRP